MNPRWIGVQRSISCSSSEGRGQRGKCQIPCMSGHDWWSDWSYVFLGLAWRLQRIFSVRIFRFLKISIWILANWRLNNITDSNINKWNQFNRNLLCAWQTQIPKVAHFSSSQHPQFAVLPCFEFRRIHALEVPHNSAATVRCMAKTSRNDRLDVNER